MEPENNFTGVNTIRSPRQERILKRLNRLVGPGSAAFYEDACWLMENKSITRSTTHLVSHLLREIESSLRDVLAPFMDRTTFKNQSGEEEHKEEILAVLQALEIQQNDPVAIGWLGITGENNIKALYSRAHRNALELPRPFDNEFKDFWYDMEFILDKVLNLFESKYLVILNQLDDLRSNKQPTRRNAKFLKNNIPSNSYAFNYFFKDLNNPAWLQPLFAEGLFAYPPEPIENKEEGTISYPLWTLSRYLITMAPLEPDLVSNIIMGIETINGNVQADFIDAVCKLPGL
jgi:hypothetical protein